VQGQAVGIREAALGPDHPDIAQSLANLSALMLDQVLMFQELHFP
jgi:hypothetical protein